MEFRGVTDRELGDEFMGILTSCNKNNTYKFALARFLLDYCNQGAPAKVRYSEIAQYFFRYYWLQECKSKLRQGPANQTPEVITIIRKEFTEATYPHTFSELRKKEPEKVRRCEKRIVQRCFDDVVPRFQRNGREFFYKYFAKEYHDASNNRKIDPGGGILLNPQAMQFLERNYVALYKAVILEWVRFLEIRNFGTPRLVGKIESNDICPRDQTRFRRHLESFTDGSCFYCEERLEPGATHVDHVLPFDYTGDTELWNLVLSCQACNCKKLSSLPPRRYLTKLQERNERYRTHDRMQRSLHNLNHGKSDVSWHYDNARKHGYPVLKNFPRTQKAGRLSRVVDLPQRLTRHAKGV